MTYQRGIAIANMYLIMKTLKKMTQKEFCEWISPSIEGMKPDNLCHLVAKTRKQRKLLEIEE